MNFHPASYDPVEMQPEMPSRSDQPVHGAAEHVTLRRVGQRPLSFRGSELCMAMSFVPGMPFWYELNVWRTEEQGFVVAVKLFFRSENERDICRAWSCESFGEVMDILEGYDAARDVRVDIAADDEAMAPAEMVAHALMLRSMAAEARRQYGAIVGEILFDLQSS